MNPAPKNPAPLSYVSVGAPANSPCQLPACLDLRALGVLWSLIGFAGVIALLVTWIFSGDSSSFLSTDSLESLLALVLPTLSGSLGIAYLISGSYLRRNSRIAAFVALSVAGVHMLLLLALAVIAAMLALNDSTSSPLVWLVVCLFLLVPLVFLQRHLLRFLFARR